MNNKKDLFSPHWIFINGQVYILNYKVSLYELFIFTKKKNPGLILEYNQKIISPNQAKTVFLKHLDRIEFVTIVGGG